MATVYNILSITETYGRISNLAPSVTTETVWTELTPTSSYTYRINAITAANVTNKSALLTLAIDNAAGGAGTAFRLAFQVVVPPNSAIVVLDKSTPLYITDDQSISVTVSVASTVELSAMYEAFTGTGIGKILSLTGASSTGAVGAVSGSRDKALTGNTATGTAPGILLPGSVVLDGNTATGTAGSVTYLVGYQRTQQVIFAFGQTPTVQNISNLVSNTGVVATDTAGVGTARYGLGAAGYGGDKAIFGYGFSTAVVSLTNLVSNTGVVATDTTGVGTARQNLAAASYGAANTTAAFAYGTVTAAAGVSMKNLVSSAGVVAADVTGVGTARWGLAAIGYGTIGNVAFAYGQTTASAYSSLKNLMNASGTIAADVTGVGTARTGVTATKYGTYSSGTSLFVGGNAGSAALLTINLLNSTGVIATDTTATGTTARSGAGASSYGGNGGNAIMAFGNNNAGTFYSISNIISSAGVIASDTTGVGTARSGLGAAGFSYT